MPESLGHLFRDEWQCFLRVPRIGRNIGYVEMVVVNGYRRGHCNERLRPYLTTCLHVLRFRDRNSVGLGAGRRFQFAGAWVVRTCRFVKPLFCVTSDNPFNKANVVGHHPPISPINFEIVGNILHNFRFLLIKD